MLESLRKVTSGSESLIAWDQRVATTLFGNYKMLVYYNYIHICDNSSSYVRYIHIKQCDNYSREETISF